MKDDLVACMISNEILTFRVNDIIPASGIVVIINSTDVAIMDEDVEDTTLASDDTQPKITYADIGGLKDEIERVREMVEYPLKYPFLFEKLGIDPPKGVLLHGPPGCGKTLIAKAVANESKATFITINGPEIMSKFYGESEQRLRKIFKNAESNAPSIIFIDELDSLAPKREEAEGEAEQRIVAQLLTLMDGLKSRGQVIVIGATNRPNIIDPALRRPGRFDREIEIGVPNKKERHEILKIHTKNMPLAQDVDLEALASMTHGFVGADLSALCREAAMKALKNAIQQIKKDDVKLEDALRSLKLEVTQQDFVDALKEVHPSAMREVLIEKPNVRWENIGGLDDAIKEIKESIEWPIKNPEAFKRMGIQPPKGILLYGPPGCGKTLIARAIATETEVNFISIKGPEVMSKWFGESEKMIRDIFRKARMAAPTIIFFDEIDSLTSLREGGPDGQAKESIVSQLLTEMDGLEQLENITIIGATNRPDLIDPALLRPGRFDKLIYIPPPDQKGRLQILKIITRDMPLAKDVDLEQIARDTEMFSGADLNNLCKEAALNALREDINAKEIRKKHFNMALLKIMPSITPELENFYKLVSKKISSSLSATKHSFI